MMAHQHEPPLQRLASQTRSARRLERGVAGLPLGSAGRELLGADSPWYESWIEHPDAEDPFWETAHDGRTGPRRGPGAAAQRLARPVPDADQHQYQQLRDRGVDVAMTVGPWAHNDMVIKAGGTAAAQTLTGSAPIWPTSRPSRGAARCGSTSHSTAGSTCRTGHRPPAKACCYLQPAGRLAAAVPPPDAAPSSFRYDPADPTPTVGGRLLNRQSGYQDDSVLARRADVLSFTSGPLDADLYVFGSPVVELAHEADIDHVDLFVRVSEVDARGRSHNVSDGYRRLSAPERPGPHRARCDRAPFRAGTQIRVLVAGGSHPRFARNLGTGEPALTGQRMVPAVHTVHHGVGGVSQLIMPASAAPSADGGADPAGDLA